MRFSVIVPCRDDQDQVRGAIRSIAAQSSLLEIIVVDDGSDPPLDLATDPKVRVIRRELSGGPAAARNAGLDAARGEFVAFCDSDDRFLADRLSVAETLHEDADVVVVRQGSAAGSDVSVSPESLGACLDGYTPHLGATSVRRSICPRFDDRFLACEDSEWWIRLASTRASFTSTSALGYQFGSSDHPRVLNSPAARLDFSYALLEQHEAAFANRPQARAFRWRRIAAMERQQGNLALSRRALVTSLRSKPSLATVREGLRLAAAAATPATAPDVVGSRPLPRLAGLRGQALRPLRVGTLESRHVYAARSAQLVNGASSTLPHALRGRSRRALTRLTGAPTVRTAWGTLPLEATDVRLLAPCFDEPLELALLARALGPGDTVVDIGANRGWFTMMASARVGSSGHVTAVEPDPRMLERLRLLVEANDLDDVVTVVPAAVAGQTATRSLIVTPEAALNHLAPAEASPEGGLEVAAISYPDLIARYGLDRPALVKIDVEGAEIEVLRSLAGAAVLPLIVMFEYEPEHWRRAGYDDADEARRLLAGTHDLYSVDYEAGGLTPVSTLGPHFAGRNVLALERSAQAALLRKMGWTEPARPGS